MIDHIGIRVQDAAQAKAFYTQALAPLGYCLLAEVNTPYYTGYGFGVNGKPDFWVSGVGVHTGAHAGAHAGEQQGATQGATQGIHMAFVAENRATVDAFYQAALAAGGRDNGAPGLRPHYHSNYYGAFVFDADGNNVEAVCHRPE